MRKIISVGIYCLLIGAIFGMWSSYECNKAEFKYLSKWRNETWQAGYKERVDEEIRRRGFWVLIPDDIDNIVAVDIRYIDGVKVKVKQIYKGGE